MEKVKQINMPVLSINNTVEKLTDAYVSVVSAGISPAALPSVMLWGPPGVGKSQAVRQIAKNIAAKTGKRTEITDVRLLLFNPIDLRGIPVANEDKTLAVWLKPKIFQMDPSEDVVNILFLDEISAAPQSVQAAAYQITLDRVVGEHKLPENCIVIAAGNRVTDKSVSFKMPKALANRLLHIEIEGSFESWKSWAVRAGIHPKVVGYLSTHPNRLFGFDPSTEDLAFATPRSWEMVSNLLNLVSEDVKKMFAMVAGLIGIGTATEFMTWCKVFSNLPTMQEVFSGRATKVPQKSDEMYALVCAMTAYASEHRNETERIGNSLAYAKHLPADFCELLLCNYRLFDKDYDSVLRTLPEYTALGAEKGKVRNGYV